MAEILRGLEGSARTKLWIFAMAQENKVLIHGWPYGFGT
jgi:hypothetical protein